jgi:hypothetical protein
VIRFQPGPIFTGSPSDYWAPTDWFQLDQGNVDLGGSGPLVVDVPGATPSSLVVAMGKDGNAYLLNRSNLGGITDPVASLQVTFDRIMQAAAAYRTNQGTFVAFRSSSSRLATFRITATNPPAIIHGWDVNRTGCGSPFVTSTDGSNDMIVWVVGASGDQKLHGYDGDTGAVIFAGGGANETMAGTHSYSTTGIAARGRIYVAGDNKVYAFTVPGGTPTPTPTPSQHQRRHRPQHLYRLLARQQRPQQRQQPLLRRLRLQPQPQQSRLQLLRRRQPRRHQPPHLQLLPRRRLVLRLLRE